MFESLSCDSPMKMDPHDGEGKEATKKEKMVPKGFEASDCAIKMETNGNRPILKEKKKVDGLNSSKKDKEQINK